MNSSSQIIRLDPIDLGDGVCATGAWVSESPFVLIEADTPEGMMRSRLDLQKRMFIDPLPGQRTPAGLHQLLVNVKARLPA